MSQQIPIHLKYIFASPLAQLPKHFKKKQHIDLQFTQFIEEMKIHINQAYKQINEAIQKLAEVQLLVLKVKNQIIPEFEQRTQNSGIKEYEKDMNYLRSIIYNASEYISDLKCINMKHWTQVHQYLLDLKVNKQIKKQIKIQQSRQPPINCPAILNLANGKRASEVILNETEAASQAIFQHEIMQEKSTQRAKKNGK